MKRRGGGSGNGGARWEDAIRLHRDKAKATVRRCLENAVQLDQAKRAKYRAAAEAVLDAMGPAALKRWNENVKSITFYPDTESITAFARSLGLDPDHVKTFRGLCLRERRKPWNCHLHLNGGADTGDLFPRDTSDGYAHEFAHVAGWVQGQIAPLSLTRAWREAWEEEKAEVNDRVGVTDRGSNEGFGDFAILAWLYPEDARRHCPKCWKIWKDQGLAGES